eukprot:1384947-Amorphochlora_amoeboformis.AAC.1
MVANRSLIPDDPDARIEDNPVYTMMYCHCCHSEESHIVVTQKSHTKAQWRRKSQGNRLVLVE